MWEGKRKILNETFLSRSQMRGNYSSSDYETVGIGRNQSERIESGGKEGGGVAICSQWTADEEVAS